MLVQIRTNTGRFVFLSLQRNDLEILNCQVFLLSYPQKCFIKMFKPVLIMVAAFNPLLFGIYHVYHE